jgi:hypothetical protein
MINTSVLTDPAALTPSQSSARLAAFLARGRGNDDPEVIARREALAYWRCRRVIDAERGQLATALNPRIGRYDTVAVSASRSTRSTAAPAPPIAGIRSAWSATTARAPLRTSRSLVRKAQSCAPYLVIISTCAP